MLQVTIQRVNKDSPAPATAKLKKWVNAALKDRKNDAELTIRIVDEDEMTELNSTYRNKNKLTNVLSFPCEIPAGTDIFPILGDIVICAAVVNREATEQNKPTDAHWAHMIVHGTLHLLGYDHEKNAEAEEMESIEIAILHSLNFANPYQ